MRRSLIAALALALALAGCTSDAEPRRQQSPSAARSSAEPAEPVDRARPGPIPARLRVPAPELASQPHPDGFVVDLLEAVAAPTVEDAPVRAGMLLAQVNFFSSDADDTIRPGEPFLLTEAGEWRRFDLTRYGFGAVPYVELSFAITRDGRRVAFADPSGLAVVDVGSNNFQRFPLPTIREAVALQWSPDGSTLLFRDRHYGTCGPPACSIDVATGRLAPMPFDGFTSGYGNGGLVHEVTGSIGPRAGRVRTYDADTETADVLLEYQTTVHTAGGPTAARHVAFVQCRRRKAPGTDGLLVVDPVSGRLMSVLSTPPRQRCGLGARAWLSDDHLVVDDWESGAMWLWDVPREQVRQVAVSATTGVNYNIAAEVMARRLGRLVK